MALVLSVAASFVCFGTSLDVGFLSDDFGLVGAVADGVHAVGWGYASGGFFRPLAIASWWADHTLFGADARGFHAVNLALHGIVGWLVGAVLAAFTSGAVPRTADEEARSSAASLLVTFAFVALSSHSEPVVWISCRADLLAAALALAATAVALGRSEARGGSLRALGASMLFMLALLAKESPITLPAVWLLLLLARARAEARGMTRAERTTVLAAFATALLYLLVRKAVLGVFVGGYGDRIHMSISPASLAKAAWKYTIRALSPALPATARHAWWRTVPYLVGLAPVAVWASVALRAREARTQGAPAAALLVSFLVLCLPALSIGLVRFGTEGERFVYLPSAFLVLGIAQTARQAFGERRAAMYALACVAFHALCLQLVLPRWSEAGDATRAIVRALADEDPTTICVLGLPDTIGGAYVFRNGLDLAVASARRAPVVSPIRVGAFVTFPEANPPERISVDVTGVRMSVAREQGAPPTSSGVCGVTLREGQLEARFDRLPADVSAVVVYAGGRPPRVMRIPVP